MTTGRRTLRALATPRAVAVVIGDGRYPTTVAGQRVDTVREEWRVEEGWWTDTPDRRRYLELVLEGGRVQVVFEDRRRPGTWYRQRG